MVLPADPAFKHPLSKSHCCTALIAGVFTTYIYPFNYIEFEYFENLPVLLMVNRNLLMIIVFILVLIGRKPQDKNIIAERMPAI
jgi:hypothetical protein